MRYKPGETIVTDLTSEGWDRTFVSKRKDGSIVYGWVRNRFIASIDPDCRSDWEQQQENAK